MNPRPGWGLKDRLALCSPAPQYLRLQWRAVGLGEQRGVELSLGVVVREGFLQEWAPRLGSRRQG